jgi:bifunctional UDP-N-acetylglucosamine pyrophosphorylase/glucosamine-1-phosphate N-acetyltransferase
MKTTAVVLAAGQGTRMRSTLPKVLFPLLGRPLILYGIETAQQATGLDPVVVIGHSAEQIQVSVGCILSEGAAHFVAQEPQLGTGHAVQQAEAMLRGQTDQVLVTPADMPLLTVQTLTYLVKAQETHTGPISMLTLLAEDPRGFGRIMRDEQGCVREIIEEAQANPDELAIRELNAGAYCFAADWLWEALRRIPLSPKGEYYLTDLVGIAMADGLSVQAIRVDDPGEAIGINTRVHLAEAEEHLRWRINRQWMLEGVTIIDPARVYIEPGVKIGQDTVIWPNTYLHGNTAVGTGCVLGPDTIIRDTSVGNGCVVLASVLEMAVLEDRVEIGPFGHLRKGAHLAQGVHMGNFGEVKNSYLGPGTKVGHFSYLGDATIEENVNIGAGTITCNFDGQQKNPTEIGAGAFIGSDTMLIAPIKVGKRARTGAGAVVTKNVPDETLVVGMPARAIRKLKKDG